MLSRPTHLSLSLFFALILAVTALLPAAAQELPPPLPVGGAPPAPGARQEAGDWSMPDGSAERTALPAEAGAINFGPDQFGYVATYVPYNWIDARSGTALPFSGYARGQFAQVSLPFAFPFYEGSYTSLYVNAPGYLSFSTPQEWWPNQLNTILPDTINHIIAPYPTVLGLADSGSTNRVFYRSGGSAPNRYFVVEWHRVKGYDHHDDNEHTFETVLFENGDILLQYQTMEYDGGWWCGSAKVENALGTDGLQLLDGCDQMSAPSAIKIARPAATARVMAYPLHQGRFSRAAFTEVFPITLQNTGALGSDRYNLSATGSTPVRFTDDSNVLLSDSNNDGIVDTGPIAPGAVRSFRAVLVTAPFASPGQPFADVTVQVRSVLNGSVSRSMKLRAMAAPGFVQAYTDYTFDGLQSSSSARLLTAHPAGPSLAAPGAAAQSEDVAVATLPGTGYVTAWIGPGSGNDWDAVHYSLHSPDGARTFTAQLAGGAQTYHLGPALAATSNGRAGIVWQHQAWRWVNERWEFNDNIYFAIVNAATGAVVKAPVNLTNNASFAAYEDDNDVQIDAATIAATTDNRFVVAWQKYEDTPTSSRSNVEYMVLNDAGAVVRGVTRASVDAASDLDRAWEPTLVTLDANRVLLAYEGVGHMLLSSSGDVVRGFAGFSGASYSVDAERLGNGNLLFAYMQWDLDREEWRLRYTLTTPDGGAVLYGPAWLDSLSTVSSPSVTRDAAGNGVITWGGADLVSLWGRRVLMDGTTPEASMPFVQTPLTAALRGTRLTLRYPYNAHSAPLAVAPTAADRADLFVQVNDVSGGTQGGNAIISISVVNRGQLPAADATLTATLPDDLTFVSAVPAPASVLPASGAPDSAAATTVTWNLPDLDHLGGGRVQMVTTVPSTTVGAGYTVDFTLTTSSPQVDPAHGQDSTSVVEMLPNFLPLVGR